MIEAINAGRIPPAFQEHLQARSNELVNAVNCAPPSTDQGETTEESEDEKDKKEKEKDEDEEDEQDEEEPVPTEPLPTITEDEE